MAYNIDLLLNCAKPKIKGVSEKNLLREAEMLERKIQQLRDGNAMLRGEVDRLSRKVEKGDQRASRRSRKLN